MAWETAAKPVDEDAAVVDAAVVVDAAAVKFVGSGFSAEMERVVTFVSASNPMVEVAEEEEEEEERRWWRKKTVSSKSWLRKRGKV